MSIRFTIGPDRPLKFPLSFRGSSLDHSRPEALGGLCCPAAAKTHGRGNLAWFDQGNVLDQERERGPFNDSQGHCSCAKQRSAPPPTVAPRPAHSDSVAESPLQAPR